MWQLELGRHPKALNNRLTMNENVKKLVEEVKDSKYFDLLIEEKIRTKSIELIKRRKWLISFVVLINLVVISLFGVKYQNFDNQIVILEKKAEKVDSLVQKYESMIANFDETQKTLSILNDYEKNFINMEKDLIIEKQNFYTEARNTLNDRLTELTNLRVKSRVEKLDSLTRVVKSYLKELKSYQNKIAPQIKVLSKTSKEIKKSSSVRYLFVERGDKSSKGIEYRPTSILIPYSSDTLTAIFHKREKRANPKQILVDIYLNHKKLIFEDLPFYDSFKLNKQMDTTFNTTEGNKYKIDLVFIYLPPNFGGRMPDYVILKIRLMSI